MAQRKQSRELWKHTKQVVLYSIVHTVAVKLRRRRMQQIKLAVLDT